MRTKVKTYISLDSKTLERIKIMAKRDNRNVSNYIDTILKNHIEENYEKKEA